MNAKRVGWFLIWIISWGIAIWLGWTLYGPDTPRLGLVGTPTFLVLITWVVATATVTSFLLVRGAISLKEALEE